MFVMKRQVRLVNLYAWFKRKTDGTESALKEKQIQQTSLSVEINQIYHFSFIKLAKIKTLHDSMLMME